VCGIDINAESIAMAKAYHSLPNLTYAAVELRAVNGPFDCILFVDVFHHVPLSEVHELLEPCSELLTPNGFVLIKDIERRRGQASWFMDRYVSGCQEIYMRNCDEMGEQVSRILNVKEAEVRFRFPFPNYYIRAVRKSC
jgi:2-polyprenyl-3-methyl-5-hydroxy-6-metoxy-1,4-benzoquinol methylase